MSKNPSQASRTVKNLVSSADHAALEEAYTFIPENKSNNESWKDRMVQRYHDGLYKEYALADLSPSRPGQVGLRWRTKDEVVNGRGELNCGNKHCENNTTTTSPDELITFEIPFAYTERGVSKKELVKLKLCPNCKPLLFFKKSSSPGGNSDKNNNRKNEENIDSVDDSDSSRSSRSSTSSNSSHDKKRSRKNRKRHKNKRKRRPGRDRKRRKRDYSSSSESSESSHRERSSISRSRKRHKRNKGDP